MRLARALIVVAAACGGLPAAAAGASSHCVECHVSIANPPFVAAHAADWQQSTHAEHDVGCEACHGGDPTLIEARGAHRDVLHSSVPRSPVNRANLYRTCAPCHAAQAGAFGGSLHRLLLDVDELRAPSCSTCHLATTFRVPLPDVLEARCAACHRPGSARADYPRTARLAVEEVARLRASLSEWSTRIAVLPEGERRRALRSTWDAAASSTTAAVTAFHAFDLKRLQTSLDAAHRDADRVVRELEP